MPSEKSPYKEVGISSRLTAKKQKRRIDNLPTKKDLERLQKKKAERISPKVRESRWSNRWLVIFTDRHSQRTSMMTFGGEYTLKSLVKYFKEARPNAKVKMIKRLAVKPDAKA